MKMYVAVVKSSSAASGAASGLTYTVQINFDGGLVEIAGIKPSTNRPPDTIDTLAAKPGTMFFVVESSPGEWAYMLQEFPDFADCPGGA